MSWTLIELRTALRRCCAVRHSRTLPVLLGVCLVFTGSGVAWADPAPAGYIEDPMQPHDTSGTTARVGTAVGFLYGERLDVTAIGMTTAIGHRYGRFALEAELDLFTFQPHQNAATHIGDGERLGVMARYDAIRLGPHIVGGNSLLALYVEGGAAVAWNHWYQPHGDELQHVVPRDTKRVEGQAGVGLMLEHRLQEPISFPRRIGWYLGWRLALAPHQSEPASVCRGASCTIVAAMPDAGVLDRSMLFQSSLEFTW